MLTLGIGKSGCLCPHLVQVLTYASLSDGSVSGPGIGSDVYGRRLHGVDGVSPIFAFLGSL